MEKQLLLLVLFVGGIWLILDQFYGKKRISFFVNGLLNGNKDLPANKESAVTI